MPEQIVEIPVTQIDTPAQSRTIFEEDSLLNLGKNMAAVGQLVPIIVCWIASVGRYLSIDGERRIRAAKLVGIKTLLAWVLDHAPTRLELHRIQMCIAVHNVALTVMEKSDQLLKIKQENNLSVSELAEYHNLKQPVVTKLLKYQDGCSDLRTALQSGTIDQDKAYTICQEPDHDRQRELLRQASDLSREQLRQKARSNGQPVELKAAVARFLLPSGAMVSVQGRKMTLAGALDAMLAVIKELKKGQSEHWDITTAMRVMRDRAKAAK